MNRCAWLLFSLLAVAGCDEVANMRKQPRLNPFDPSPLPGRVSSARPVPLGAVTRSGVVAQPFERGEPPPQPPTTLGLLRRGQVLYNVQCSVCHDQAGYGFGMVVQRGFPEPPSFHSARLRDLPDPYLFQVITHGLGKMPSYAADVAPSDRWAVIAYVRALQLSQNASLSDLPADVRERLVCGSAATAPTQKAAEVRP